jgi:hypothetical protein
MLFFIILSLIGFLISLAVHVSTFLGVSPQDAIPGLMFLHVGIFIVFIPAVVAQNTVRKASTPPDDKSAQDHKRWDGMQHAPRWLSNLAIASSWARRFSALPFPPHCSRGTSPPAAPPAAAAPIANRPTHPATSAGPAARRTSTISGR